MLAVSPIMREPSNAQVGQMACSRLQQERGEKPGEEQADLFCSISY